LVTDPRSRVKNFDGVRPNLSRLPYKNIFKLLTSYIKSSFDEKFISKN